MIKVTVYNQQRDYKISRREVASFVRQSLALLDVSPQEVILHFVSTRKICQLHSQFFQDPSPTDCITFPIDAEILGEAFICPKMALSYQNPKQELFRYIAHTLLHMCGWKDKTKIQKRTMRSKENYLLKAAELV